LSKRGGSGGPHCGDVSAAIYEADAGKVVAAAWQQAHDTATGLTALSARKTTAANPTLRTVG
jgi:hypothetical protein